MDPFRQVRQYSEKCDAGEDSLNREIFLDMRFMMTDSVLMKVDRMSMASSLEIRVPLLDHVLVEYMAALPGDWKMKKLTTKYIFRSALEGLLPDKVVHRGKQGYSLPVKHLLRGELHDYMVQLINDSKLIRENMDSIGQHWDMKYGKSGERPGADDTISNVALPGSDPVFGSDGPLVELWR